MLRREFTAQLHSQYGQIGVSQPHVAGQHWVPGVAEDYGWLCHEQSAHPPPAPGASGEKSRVAKRPVTKMTRFRFTYVREEPGRIYYYLHSIDAGAFNDGRVEQSPKGWLGIFNGHRMAKLLQGGNPLAFLPESQSQRIWKLEIIGKWDGAASTASDVEFYLRDSRGHRVADVVDGNFKRGYRYLRASGDEGQILRFRLHDIQFD